MAAQARGAASHPAGDTRRRACGAGALALSACAQTMKMFGKSDSALGIGDRFAEANRERTEWTVEFVFGDPNGVAHARLRKVGDSTVARTFAVAVLMADPRFKRLPRQSFAPSPSEDDPEAQTPPAA